MGMEIPGIIQSRIHTKNSLNRNISNSNQHNITNQNIKNKQQPGDIQDFHSALLNLEKAITQFNRRFKIYADNNINRIIIKVIDRETDKVIREIPPEEIQHLLTKINEMVGLLVDKTI
jgi:flagellar protein FlaG